MGANDQFLSGVIEGFYGQPWSQAERFELFDWMQAWGMDTYVYAPKDDLKHRALWRETYSATEVGGLRELIERARTHNIRFFYALAPGLDIRYANSNETDHILTRFNQMLALGCEHFALLFDDIPDAMTDEDTTRFGSFASAQADITNKVFGWTRERSPQARFLFCPTPYCGRMAASKLGGARYLEILGKELWPEIDVFWTGSEIVSRSIAPNNLPPSIGRKPVIWDNLHANDYDRSRFYCGPYSGRDPAIRFKVNGILTNPNNEFPLNFIAIRTLAMFNQCTEEWDPRKAFLKALGEWEPKFKSLGNPISFDHLRAFFDCYYLPHEDGPEAREFCGSAGCCVRDGQPEWLKSLRTTAKLLREFCQRATELQDRKLFYALSQRIWDLREEIDLLERYVAHRSNPETAHQPFGSDYHLPKTYRGSFVRRLQRLLVQQKDGTFVPNS